MSLTNVNITNPLRDNKAIMLFTEPKGGGNVVYTWLH